MAFTSECWQDKWKERSVFDAISGRRSIRRFLADPVPIPIIKEVMGMASRAPSGTNSQPWMVHIVSGAAKKRVEVAVREAALAGRTSLEYPYAPHPWWEPFVSRRRKVGYDLYAARGIAREDKEARAAAALENFEFFGAPLGLFFTMDRNLLYGSWLDCGIFMGNVMALARGYGLDTCPQQSWCQYGAVVHEILEIAESELIVSGMAIGYADDRAPVNQLCTERETVEEFTRLHGA